MIWLAVVLCLLVSFIFSGIEAGILSINRIRLRHRVKMRDPAAIRLQRLIAHPERLLVTVLFVTNLANIFAITLTTEEGLRHLGPRGYLAALIILLPIYLFGLELLPKSLFRRFPYRALAALAGPLRLADLLLSPLRWIGVAVSRRLPHRTDGHAQKLFAAREEFKYLTIESERTGTLTPAERHMIHNVVDFRAITARDIMLPIAAVRTIPADTAIPLLLTRAASEKISRWPVTSELGEIIGVIDTFDIALDGRRRGPIHPFQRRIVKIAPGEPAYTVLRKLRAARGTLAAVIGEGARPLGIVTWEDLIRRLVSTGTE